MWVVAALVGFDGCFLDVDLTAWFALWWIVGIVLLCGFVC